MHKIFHPSNKERTLFFIGLLFVSGTAVVYLVKDYIPLISLSVIFAIMVHPIYVFLKTKCRLPNSLATLSTLVIAFALIILPILFTAHILLQELQRIGSEISLDKNSTSQAIQSGVKGINVILSAIPIIKLHLTTKHVTQVIENAGKSIDSYLLNTVLLVGSASIKYLAELFIFLILTYFTIPALPKIKSFLVSISPFRDDIDELYITRSIALIISLLKTIFVIALAQGILGGVFLWLGGIPYVLTLTILLIFASLIPFVGTNIIIIPIAIMQILQGNYASAGIILFGQFIFVTNVDNILAAAIISRNTSLHPALMLISLVGGVSVMGLPGILFGPIIMILFVTTIEVYEKHYKL